MRIAFCPFIELLGADIPVVVDCHVADATRNPRLVIDNILDSTGKVSLLHNETKAYSEIGYLIADMAEDDERLLAKAVEQASYESEAA